MFFSLIHKVKNKIQRGKIFSKMIFIGTQLPFNPPKNSINLTKIIKKNCSQQYISMTSFKMLWGNSS